MEMEIDGLATRLLALCQPVAGDLRLLTAVRYSPEFSKGSAGVVAIRTKMGDDTATNVIPGVDFRSGIHLGTWAPRVGLFGPIVKGRAWFSKSAEAEYRLPRADALVARGRWWIERAQPGLGRIPRVRQERGE